MSSFWDFLFYIFSSLFETFLIPFRADKRPKARRMTVGCFTLLLLLGALVGLYFALKS